MLAMLIGEHMSHLKFRCFVILMVLFCAFGVICLVEDINKGTEEVLGRQLLNPEASDVRRDMTELLWIYCRLEIKEASELLSSQNPEAIASELDSHGWSAAKATTIQKLFEEPHSQEKQTLFDCLRRNNILLDVSHEEGGSDILDNEHFDSSHHISSRRNLVQGSSKAPSPPNSTTSPLASKNATSPLPSPSKSKSPSPSKSKSKSPSPTTSPSPSPSPSPTPFPSPKGAGAIGHSPPPPPPQPPPPPSNKGHSPPSPRPPSPPPPIKKKSASPHPNPTVYEADQGADNDDDQGNHQQTVVIAVAATAAATVAVAACFFICCASAFMNGAGARQKDEKPLLGLSLSDSIGSSHKSYDLSNSSKEEKYGKKLSLSNDPAHNNANLITEGGFKKADESSSLGSIGGMTKVSSEDHMNLPPPPGRMVVDPPLKPPGRTQPPPPNAPGSLRSPPGRAAPPQPSPPTKNANAGPHPPAAPSSTAGAPPLPPNAPGVNVGPRAPPPPPGVGPKAPPPPMRGPRAPPPPLGQKGPRPPGGPKFPSKAGEGDDDTDAKKTKLKPFFWDKVMANPDQSMVWDHIKGGSFQFNEEMIESLFGCAPPNQNKNDHKKEPSSRDPSPQFVQIIDPKKSQNLLILLRAQNVTIEEVCDALLEGNELPAELIQTLLKMAPTTEEELKLRIFSGEISQLGPAERFLKALVDIPFAYRRMEALLFMCTLEEESTSAKEAFVTLEIACKELRNSRLFLKLLEAVLKTGNRMNDGTYRGGAQAFKLDTLLKLSDVKGKDGKTTLLLFVVKEIIRSEGLRAARATRDSRSFSNLSCKTDDLLDDITPDTEEHFRSLGLQVVSRLSSELENVKKAAVVDSEGLTGTVAKLRHSLMKTREFLSKEMDNVNEDNGFAQTLKAFLQNAEVSISALLEEEKRIMALVKSTGDYFHGSSGKDEGLRLFVIVRDFLIILDKVCKEVGEAQKRAENSLKKDKSSASAVGETPNRPSVDLHQRLFPALASRKKKPDSSSSSDDER